MHTIFNINTFTYYLKQTIDLMQSTIGIFYELLYKLLKGNKKKTFKCAMLLF